MIARVASIELRNEISMFGRAILRIPGANAHQGLTSAGLGAPDFGLMLDQHETYRRALEATGVALTVLEADERFPDSCFVEDTAVIAGTLAVITRPGAPTRRGEVEAMTEVLACRLQLAHIEAPGTVDGGDVLIAGERVLIGLSSRTNATGAAQLAALLDPHGFRVQTVPVVGIDGHAAGLHLKSDLSFIGDRLLVTSAYAGRIELADFAQIVVPDGEEYAANCIDLGSRLLIAEGFPRTRERLEREGFVVESIDVSEFRKMDGGLSCLSLRF
jgi:dimethylargininase